MKKEFTYYAFISYNSRDTIWGKRLQHKLEHYRLPATLCSEKGWSREPIKPVFFAPTDIQPGGLDEELKARLRASQNLIVICSPNSVGSKWVGKEIEYFHELGRENKIHFFIVAGVPYSGDPTTECINPVVKELGIPEILGANIHEKIYRWPWLNRERAYVQLISKLLGVEFDSIWQRHRRRFIAKTVTWVISILCIIAVMLGVWICNQPFDSKISIAESSAYNHNLPPMENAVVTMILDNEMKSDTICRSGGHVTFPNIPHSFLGNMVRFRVDCQNFLPLDTLMPLIGNMEIPIRRDPKLYGEIHKRLWDWKNEAAVVNTIVFIDGIELQSDADGIVQLFIPLEQQREFYQIEIPSWNIIDTVFMPCEEGQIIILE